MATAQQLIERALTKIQVKGAETPLTTTELDDGLIVLNQMAAELEQEGFELYTSGYSVLALGDTVPIPDYALNFYTLQLAGRLAPEYLEGGVPAFLPDLIQGARRVVVRALNSKSVGLAGTYRDIIYGAFEIGAVKTADQPLTTTELSNAIPRLNDYIATLESKGFRLSYQISDGSNLDATHGLPDWSWSWIKAGLAARLASSYGVPLNETVMAMIADGERAAYSRFGTIPKVEYPDTLPIGSSRWYEKEFFSNEAYDDLQVSQGGTLLDDEGDPLERNA